MNRITEGLMEGLTSGRLLARAEKAEAENAKLLDALNEIREMFGVHPEAGLEELVNLVGARSGPKCSCGPVTVNWDGFGWEADPACPVCGPQITAWAADWYAAYRRDVEARAALGKEAQG